MGQRHSSPKIFYEPIADTKGKAPPTLKFVDTLSETSTAAILRQTSMRNFKIDEFRARSFQMDVPAAIADFKESLSKYALDGHTSLRIRLEFSESNTDPKIPKGFYAFVQEITAESLIPEEYRNSIIDHVLAKSIHPFLKEFCAETGFAFIESGIVDLKREQSKPRNYCFRKRVTEGYMDIDFHWKLAVLASLDPR